jgi:hypothetical protein
MKSVSLRWKSHHRYNSISAVSLINQLDTTNFPQLESLTISNLWNFESHLGPRPPASPLFSVVPGLRALTIEDIKPMIVPRHGFVKNITKLNMRSIRVYRLSLTRGVPTTIRAMFKLDALHDSLQTLQSPRPRTLSKLINLRIDGYCSDFDAVETLLHVLTLPRLEFVNVAFRLDHEYYGVNCTWPNVLATSF